MGEYNRKTKIICTIGPASEDEKVIRELIVAGMDVARINMSHGCVSEHVDRIRLIQKIREQLNKPVAILLDTRGPEVRISLAENGDYLVKEDQEFNFYMDDRFGNGEGVGISYKKLNQFVKKGATILVDDGKISFRVEKVSKHKITTIALNTGMIGSRKSLNVPGVDLHMDFLEDLDKEGLNEYVKEGIEFVAASFARTLNDIKILRTYLDSIGGSEVEIIAKIESAQGVDNAVDILKGCAGLMVARGDLGVELPYYKIPIIQKDLIHECYNAGKVVITATQMLESMINNPRPTRAEISDVANAIFDGSSAIMLSGETAMGKYPVETLKTMVKVTIATENSINYSKRFMKYHLDLGDSSRSVIASAAVAAAMQINAKAIIATSRSGKTAEIISAYHPYCPIIAPVVVHPKFYKLAMFWNIIPLKASEVASTDEMFENSVKLALEKGLIEIGDKIILTGGSQTGDLATDMLKIRNL